MGRCADAYISASGHVDYDIRFVREVSFDLGIQIESLGIENDISSPFLGNFETMWQRINDFTSSDPARDQIGTRHDTVVRSLANGGSFALAAMSVMFAGLSPRFDLI